jgi:hypothetical protein
MIAAGINATALRKRLLIGVFGSVKRRGRDLNPRRTQRPETVFETAAFDRSATPPKGRTG